MPIREIEGQSSLAHNVVPFAQAYSDTFCLPGWQPARFIEELDPWTVVTQTPEPQSLELRARGVLAALKVAFPDAIVIGGWATWLRACGDMSHDIDMT